MVWNQNKPADNESPALAPGQIRTNWSRINAIIDSDHLFAASVSADQGYHKIMHHVTQAGVVGDGAPAPSAGVGQLYTKTITTTGVGGSTAGAGEHLCYQRGTGGTNAQEASLSACPARASVNFIGKSSNGVCTINWAYNVAQVDRTANGVYKITFTNDMPSTFYVPFVSATPGTGNRVQPQLLKGSFALGSFSVEFYRDSTSTQVNPQVATIIVFGG